MVEDGIKDDIECALEALSESQGGVEKQLLKNQNQTVHSYSHETYPWNRTLLLSRENHNFIDLSLQLADTKMLKMSSVREANREGYLAPFVLAPHIDVHTGASFAGSIWASPGFHKCQRHLHF